MGRNGVGEGDFGLPSSTPDLPVIDPRALLTIEALFRSFTFDSLFFSPLLIDVGLGDHLRGKRLARISSAISS